MSRQGRRAPTKKYPARAVHLRRSGPFSQLARRAQRRIGGATTPGKIAAGIAGATGTSSAGLSAFAIFRTTSAHAVPNEMWVALVALAASTGLISSLGLILEYRLRKLDIEARSTEAQSAAELRKCLPGNTPDCPGEGRQGEPGSADNYREIILANALYLSVEQNGVQLADKTHEQLYGLAPRPHTRRSSPTGTLPSASMR